MDSTSTSSTVPPAISNHSHQDKPKRTRNRIALSCSICRARKVKCSKDKPHCKQCEKAGVAHLCTYLDQPWAAQSQKQITKDHELKILKERVKTLEEMLSKVHNSSTASLLNVLNSGNSNSRSNSSESNTSPANADFTNLINQNKNNSEMLLTSNNILANSSDTLINISGSKNGGNFTETNNIITPATSTAPNDANLKLMASPESGNDGSAVNSNNNGVDAVSKKYDYDELDLTKRFDMLHLKNTGTVHLGATHWLAIMKGDPYLKLLWSHIFTIREKITEWHKQQALFYNRKMAKRKCPHPLNIMEKAQCPVTHATGTVQNCPAEIISNAENERVQRQQIVPSSSADSVNNAMPQQQQQQQQQHISQATTVNTTAFNNQNDGTSTANPSKGKCPFDHTKLAGMKQPLAKPHKTPTGIPSPAATNPSIKNITHDTASTTFQSKCPVMHHDQLYPQPGQHSSYQQVDRPSSFGDLKKLGSPPLPNNMNPEQDFQIMQRVIDELNVLLPPQRVIALLIDKFFKFLYLVIPILDEQSFRSQIYQIIQAPQDKTKQNISIKIAKTLDYCTLGILVIILRLTWLSLPFNGCDTDLGLKIKNQDRQGKKGKSKTNSKGASATPSLTKDEELLRKYGISATAVSLVRKYLVRFDEISSFSNKNVNITTVQFAIFYKMYLSTCPEGSESSTSSASSSFTSTGHDNETHQVLLSSIVQMAFSCGLHRDPDNFPQLNSSDLISLPNTQHLNTKTGKTQNESKTSKKRKTNAENNPHTANSQINKESAANTEKLKHVWRKTWFFIVSLDVQQSLSLGTPRLLRNLGDFSDTKLPCSSKIDYVTDIKELIIVKNFTLFFQIDLCIIAVLNHILNVSLAKTVRKFELDELINALQVLSYGQNMEGELNANITEVVEKLISKGLLFTSEATALASTMSTMVPTAGAGLNSEDKEYTLPVLKKVLSTSTISSTIKKEKENGTSKKLDLPQEITTRALFFAKHLTIRMLLYLLNYILFTHYEPQGNEDIGTLPLTAHYAQSALNFAMDGFKNSVLFFVTNKQTSAKSSNCGESIFSHMEVLLAPQCLDACHRSLQFMICLILRARCGPLTGLNETAITSTSGSNSGSGMSSEEENDNSSRTKAKKDYDSMLFDKNEKLELNDDLGELLLSRMELFHRLTRKVSVKYKYAEKMTRSTGFFLTLLKDTSKKSGSSKKDRTNDEAATSAANAEPHGHGMEFASGATTAGNVTEMPSFMLPKLKSTGAGNMSKFFKNIPSLIISAGGDQLKRCPVYQDAVGFFPKDLHQGAFSKVLSNPSAPRNPTNNFVLPHITTPNSSAQAVSPYQPVTYSAISRRTSDIRNEELNEMHKRRKISAPNLLMPSPEPPSITPRQRMLSETLPLPGLRSVAASPLPAAGSIVKTENMSPSQVRPDNFVGFPSPLLRNDNQEAVAAAPQINQPIPQMNPTNMPFNPVNKLLVANQYLQENGQHVSQPLTSSPSLMSEATSSSSVNYAPDFEEFLKQSTDINGLIVNPSNFMEAVGFDDFRDPSNGLLNSGLRSGSMAGLATHGLNSIVGGVNGPSDINFSRAGMVSDLDFMDDARQFSEANSVWVINEDFQGMESTGIEGLHEIINGNSATTLAAGHNTEINVGHNQPGVPDFSSWE